MELIPDNIRVKDNSIAIIGFEDGGAGQIASWIEKYNDIEIACFVNPSDNVPMVDIEQEQKKRSTRLFSYPTQNSFKNKPLITSLNWGRVLRSLGIKTVLVTVSNNQQRCSLIKTAQDNSLKMISAIHPTALILEGAVIGQNVMIHQRAMVGYCAEIGDGALVNSNASIDHHCVLKQCCLIAPGAVLGGNVTVGEFASVWAGAVIIHRINIGANATVGAGAVIIRDVEDNCTVVGVPGKRIEK